MTKDELLRDRTYKEDGIETSRRVFYTLTDSQTGKQGLVDPIQARTAKLVALLAERLVDDGTITIDTLDEMLLQIVA
ncbi:hypothetical protein K6Y78_24110 [Burkholderia cenocepacia]|nr:hypothetical protein [Burkholderia cenocepacia]MCW3586114.1 hypothetical protein [Burkholderia cenocepacia]MCW3631243.1 hypothetical protein [Burkholderia cenocepacia]MCW5184450.1 hypothetical protein [Burkholderia cenocepacia]